MRFSDLSEPAQRGLEDVTWTSFSSVDCLCGVVLERREKRGGGGIKSW
jgi:hypothetical protein